MVEALGSEAGGRGPAGDGGGAAVRRPARGRATVADLLDRRTRIGLVTGRPRAARSELAEQVLAEELRGGSRPFPGSGAAPRGRGRRSSAADGARRTSGRSAAACQPRPAGGDERQRCRPNRRRPPGWSASDDARRDLPGNAGTEGAGRTAPAGRSRGRDAGERSSVVPRRTVTTARTTRTAGARRRRRARPGSPGRSRRARLTDAGRTSSGAVPGREVEEAAGGRRAGTPPAVDRRPGRPRWSGS